ncbi:hypothetical protein Cst_c01700 [Thermoclostridium stercorarium subsp. stercorarium DSM 8532]|uniref:DUF58 domain-containing protein n=1 Tax=Thermoclostridium stercorarium (strain ATCC 35414 / DSM 8532 / NCIMB 11754) TaxID=1121335 RepID=L7VL57_THES1|nr:DUF58 domain-containing protein [Thermoclostridium stercorarium]AGC67196.1 hypothetical protein Cst_c01700 [Thermoclostridium stercorarium subsp. stercorarium DSM 8532]AGI38274.1 hypothetical protein Clst_0163 [Thermoclostridium stercorarium subsp. stercorarium DSM 8532]
MWVYKLIIAAIVVLIVESVAVMKFGLSKVSIERKFDTLHAQLGQTVHMIETISNRKLLPVPWLKVESRIDSGLRFGLQEDLNILQDEFHVSVFTMLPYTRIIRTHTVKCTKRGYYHLKSAALTARSITGTISAIKDETTDAKLYVFPGTLTLSELNLPSHSWQGDRVVRRWILEDPLIFAGIREYTTSDPIKNINWKATARMGTLQVNQYEPTANHRLMVFLNVDTKPDQWTVTDEPERVEYGISVAATVLEYASRNVIEAGFCTNGYLKDMEKEPVRIEPAGGKNHLVKMLECLARMVISRSITFYTLLDRELENNPGNTDYLFITAYVDDGIEERIRRLRTKGNAVEILRI